MAIHYHFKWHNMFAQTVCWIQRSRQTESGMGTFAYFLSPQTHSFFFFFCWRCKVISDVLGSVHPRILQKLYSKVSFLLAVAFHLSFLQFKHSRLDRISHVLHSLYLLKLCARDIIVSHLICSVGFFSADSMRCKNIYTDLQLNLKHKTTKNKING